MTPNNKWRIALNVLMVVMTVAGLLMMFFWRYGKLLDNGWQGFKYFTVLSNVFGGAAALVWLIFSALGVSERTAEILSLLKYAAAVCLGLTFTVVMIFLGPLYGYFSMFVSANFFFHLMTPFAAMLEFILFNERQRGMNSCVLAMTPMAGYAAFYLIFNLIMGRGEDPFQYDWYGFLLWGWPVGIGIAAAICLLTFGIAALLRFFNIKARSRGAKPSDT